jgi:hypothetical protein
MKFIQIIIDKLYPYFNLIVFISFFLTVITGILGLKFNLGGHLFNVPLLFWTLLFLSIFFTFTFTPSRGGIARTVGGWQKHLVSFLILAFVVIGAYFAIYLPVNSKLIAEIPAQFLNNAETPLIFKAYSNKKYYIEIDSNFISDGINAKVQVSNDSWSDKIEFIVGKKSNQGAKSVSGTTLRDLPFNFPLDGVYKLYIEFDKINNIRSVRLFEK